jgi:hypothetical protein
MRKLLLRLVAFAAIVTVAVPGVLLRFDLLRLHEVLGSEVWEALRNTEKTVAPKLDVVLGDSLARQLYGEGQESGQFWSLASNQAVTIVGQWILLRKFAEHNDMRGRRVFLVTLPSAFTNELRSNLTFHYFLKPFYWSPGDPDLSPLVRERIRDIPLSWTALVPIVKLSRWSPVPRAHDGDGPLGPVAVDYLRRMRELGRERGFTVKVLAPFVRRSTRSAYDDGAFRQAVERASLEDLFDRYYLRVMPDEAFEPWGPHLSPFARSALPDNPLAL